MLFGRHELVRLLILSAPTVIWAVDPTWASLKINAPTSLNDANDKLHYVNVMVGTPPQVQPLAVSVEGVKLALLNSQCSFCSGSNLFDPTLSSSYHEIRAFGSNSIVSNDTVHFGEMTSPLSFLLINDIPFHSRGTRFKNGIMGLWVDISDETTADGKFLPSLYNSGNLLNPVVGMSFHPNRSKLTIGALDSSDYVGNINWVPVGNDTLFPVDGFIGANGSMLPSPPLLGAISTLSVGILMPNSHVYFKNEDYTGISEDQIIHYNDAFNGEADFAYLCNQTIHPFVSISVQINGVQYPITSSDLLETGNSSDDPGYCSVGIGNYTDSDPGAVTGQNMLLGLPYMRSIYMAYRFPTESCPGYYGFAFPASNSLQKEIIEQVPRTVPSPSDHCLAFKPPINSVSPSNLGPPGISNKTYAIYGRPDQLPVQLFDVDSLSNPSIRGPDP